VQAPETGDAATLGRQNFNGQFRILQKTGSRVDHANWLNASLSKKYDDQAAAVPIAPLGLSAGDSAHA
jgi:hypothetical protein